MKSYINCISENLFSGWDDVFRHENLLRSRIAEVLEQEGYAGYEIYMPNPSGHTDNIDVIDSSFDDEELGWEDKIIKGIIFKEKPFGEFIDSVLLYGSSYNDISNKALFIAPGDCAVITFRNEYHNLLGITHAGWKGLAQDVIGKTVNQLEDMFGESVLTNLKVDFAPFAQSCCMEFGSENFEKGFIYGEVPFGKEKKEVNPLGNKYNDLNIRNYLIESGESFYLNTENLLKDILLSFGISEENINISDICTICTGHDIGYYSSRRDKSKRFGVVTNG